MAGAASADTELLRQLGAVDARDPRPVALFVDDGDADAAALAVRAGVSAYVVNGLAAARVRPVLEVAVARFRAVRELKDEVERGRSALAERKVVERAKGLLMRQRGVGEDEAYRMLRKAAMDQNRRVVEIARSLLAVAEMLTPGTR